MRFQKKKWCLPSENKNIEWCRKKDQQGLKLKTWEDEGPGRSSLKFWSGKIMKGQGQGREWPLVVLDERVWNCSQWGMNWESGQDQILDCQTKEFLLNCLLQPQLLFCVHSGPKTALVIHTGSHGKYKATQPIRCFCVNQGKVPFFTTHSHLLGNSCSKYTEF